MFIFFSILLLMVISPFLIGYSVVKLTEKERPKGLGKDLYNKSKTGMIEQQKIAEQSAKFIPNFVPKKERFKNSLIAVFLLLYGGYGIATGSLLFPARGGALELYGAPAWVMYIALIFTSLKLLAVVLDHYDKRDNQSTYKSFNRFFKVMAWIFFIISIILAVGQHSHDFQCDNEIALSLPKERSDKKAVLFYRYCALHDYNLDASPSLQISIMSSKEELRNKPGDILIFKQDYFLGMDWEKGYLIIHVKEDINSTKNKHIRIDKSLKNIVKIKNISTDN